MTKDTETAKKFLTDGRKVAVLGKLNNAEYIVQEIFVTPAGEEIPSGENFTAKSLHDAPIESYHKKEEARQKAYVEKAKGAGNEFACHQSGAEKPATCAGYLLRGARHNMATRLKAMSGKIDFASISDDGLELFESYRDMAEANGVSPNDPVLRQCRD